MSSSTAGKIDQHLLASIIDYLQTLRTEPSVDADGLESGIKRLCDATRMTNQQTIQDQKLLMPLSILSREQLAREQALDSDPKFLHFLSLEQSKAVAAAGASSSNEKDRLRSVKAKWLVKTVASNSQQPIASLNRVSDDDKTKAEQHKAQGNQFLVQQNFDAAIAKYSDAIRCNPYNAIYFANRAAACINLQRYAEAEEDCRQSLELDGQYMKAWYRLGQALIKREGLHELSASFEAVHAFEQALNRSANDLTMKATIEEQLSLARSKVDSLQRDGPSSVSSSSAIPTQEEEEVDGDESVQADSNDVGGLNALLNNPMIAQMASSMGLSNGKGGLDLGALMNNPAIMQMAQQMFAGGSAPSPSASPSVSPSAPATSGLPPNLQAFLASPAASSLAADPELAPMLSDVQRNGQGAIMKHLSNPRIMSKLQRALQQNK